MIDKWVTSFIFNEIKLKKWREKKLRALTEIVSKITPNLGLVLKKVFGQAVTYTEIERFQQKWSLKVGGPL